MVERKNNRRPWYKDPRIIIFSVVAILAILVITSVTTFMAPPPPTAPPPSPVNRISTTLHPDGISGSNYFQAAWNLEGNTPEETASLQQSVSDMSSSIESTFETNTRTWIDSLNDLLILETTVDFNDPAEIEGILAIIYGLGYGRPDISLEIRGPYSTELETSWFIEMTINPEHVPCVENFKWKVIMPARITNVIIKPDDANVLQSSLGSNISEFTFGPEDQFVTVSVTAEESRGISKIIWPIVTGVATATIVALLGFFSRRIVEAIKARRRKGK